MHFLANNVPEKPAIIVGELVLTFGQLEHEIDQCARVLEQLPKAILILEATPSFSFIIQLLAAFSINQPVALFPPFLSEEEKNSRYAILGNTMRINEQGQLLEQHHNDAIGHHPELTLILFTSGTTGEVKAVQLSQKNIEANVAAVIKALEFNQITDQLLFLPLSYSFGLLGQLLPGLKSGISTQLISQFTDIKVFLDTQSAPHMWSGVPSHWVAIAKMAKLYPENAATIKAIVSAGAPLPVSLRAELRERFPNATIYNNYGLTEASPRVLTYSSKDPLFMDSYAGYPVGNWEATLSEDQELLLRGDQMMLGYLGDEKATKIRNGWLHTGDLAEILPSGLVAIKGRRDNVVNIGGEKVNLAEIEQKIGHIDAIQEVVVVPINDELYGIRLLVCVAIKPATSKITEQQLTERIQSHLLPRKLPVTARIFAQLPRNQNGKLDRKKLQAQTRHPEQSEGSP